MRLDGNAASAVTSVRDEGRVGMSAEHIEIGRINIGDGIYVRVPQSEEAAAKGADAAPASPTPRAWTVRPAAVAAASGLAAVALVRLGVTAHGLLAAALLG